MLFTRTQDPGKATHPAFAASLHLACTWGGIKLLSSLHSARGLGAHSSSMSLRRARAWCSYGSVTGRSRVFGPPSAQDCVTEPLLRGVLLWACIPPWPRNLCLLPWTPTACSCMHAVYYCAAVARGVAMGLYPALAASASEQKYDSPFSGSTSTES